MGVSVDSSDFELSTGSYLEIQLNVHERQLREVGFPEATPTYRPTTNSYGLCFDIPRRDSEDDPYGVPV